jgi:hypothetical protein
LFKTFYEKVRVKIAYRDPRKIPAERLYEVDKKLYLISFSMEGVDLNGGGPSNIDGDDDDKGDDDEGSDDRFDDLEGPNEHIDTDKTQAQTPNIVTQRGNSQYKGGAKIVQMSSDEENQLSQTPNCMAHLYAPEQRSDECDSEQQAWLTFLHAKETHIEGVNLLEAMEMVDGESDYAGGHVEGKEVLAVCGVADIEELMNDS